MLFYVRFRVRAFIFLFLGTAVWAESPAEPKDAHGWIEQGNQALAQNLLQTAAIAFQRAIDVNPSSAKAHEQLGITLTREIVKDSNNSAVDPDLAHRAEDNLKRAIELAPSATRSLMELSDLDALLAARTSDPQERAERYQSAQDLLKQLLAKDPGKPGAYLAPANLERDEFSPALQQAKSRSGKNSGPLADAETRHALRQQYGEVINDAIASAQKAAEMDPDATQPLLLMSRLLQERALIRETEDEYTSDMHTAEDWHRQFLSAGNHAAAPK